MADPGEQVNRFGYPLLLLFIIVAFFWKLTLTREFEWMWGPDLAHQVLPWFEEEARQVRHLEFPLWDPHTWAGQPFLAQGQPGAAYPLNWLLFALPPKRGHVSTVALAWYFVVIHYMAALFCYLLCRDLGLSRAAALLGGLVFALGSYVGTVVWPQMLNGAVWTPLVFLFLLRAVRGYRPVASAALSGLFWGMSWLSGHHQAPIFISLAAAGVWIFYVMRERSWRLARLAVIAAGFMFLTAALQIIPAEEYGHLAKRWVGASEPVDWKQPVPYSVHQTYSVSPLAAFGIVFPGIASYTSPFIGFVALSLAAAAIITGWKRHEVKLFAALAVGGFAYALGFHNVLQGLLYALVPFVEKARAPAMALVVFGFGAAVLAAYGVDQLHQLRGSEWGRRIAWGSVGFGLLTALVLFCVLTSEGFAWKTDDRSSMTALIAIFLGALLFSWYRESVSERNMHVLLAGLLLIELGNVSGYDFADRNDPSRFAWLNQIRSNPDIEGFLNRQPRPFRVDMDGEEIGQNWPEYNNFDQIKAYLASVTTNWTTPAFFEPPTRSLFGVQFTIGKTTAMPDAQEVFQAVSGIKVFRNPHAFPRAWAVHEFIPISKASEGHVLIAQRLEELRSKAFYSKAMGLQVPNLRPCATPRDEAVTVTRYRPERVSLRARMVCDGMVVLSDTYYPGWKASLDGRPAPIYEVNFTMRGVVVGPGAHEIEYRYRPTTVYAGAALSATGIFGACSLAFFGRKRRDAIDLGGETRNNQK